MKLSLIALISCHLSADFYLLLHSHTDLTLVMYHKKSFFFVSSFIKLKKQINKWINKQPHLFVFAAYPSPDLPQWWLLSQVSRYPSDYTSHSFRIEVATTAVAVGMHPCNTQGRWNSNAYVSYVCCLQSVITATLLTVSVLHLEPWLTLMYAINLLIIACNLLYMPPIL